jgi:hypothetical protein
MYECPVLSPIAAACRWSMLLLSAQPEVQPQRYTLTCTHSLERVTGIEPRTISLGIRQIAADEAAEQPTWETRSSRG